MQTLQISQQEAAQELLARRQARKSLLAFTEYTTPRWTPGPIHRQICTQLDRVFRKEVDRIMLLCPPQHGKSTVASKRAPAYCLGLDPTLDIIAASATSQLAEEFGREVRNCISSPEYGQLFETTLAEDSQAKGRWNTTERGGYYAVGIGGALFGRGASLAIVDDPFATWEDAQSELSRKRVWDWYTGTFYNRIRPGGAIVIIQHRMHEDDLVGKLLDAEKHGGDKWEVVNITADPENPPWPERYDTASLERIRDNTDARQWSALYMQNPVPEEGDYFKRDWFNEYEEAPKDLHVYGASDYAVTEGDGDYTEHGVFGVDFNRNVYLLAWWRGQKSSDVWIEAKCDLINEYKPLCWFGESGPIRRSIEPFLMRRMTERGAMCRIEWLASIADKPTRARSFQALASMGKVHFPKGKPWADEVKGQLLRFPAGKYDDGVDVCSLIGRGLEFIKSPRAKRAPVASPVVGGWMGA